MIETATFGANRVRLAAFGLAGEVNRLQPRAARRSPARHATSPVATSSSPARSGRSARRHATSSHLDEARVRAAFREQIDGLLEGGVDLLVLETFVDLRHLLIAADEARRATADLPIVAQLTFGEELELADGSSPATAAAALAEAGVDVDRRQLRRRAARLPRGAGARWRRRRGDRDARPPGPSPNAGLPQRIEGQFVYAAGPDYFGAMVAAHDCGGSVDRRRLLRDDARAHRADAAALDASTTAGAIEACRRRPPRCRPSLARRSSRPRPARPRRRRPPRAAAANPASRELLAGRFVVSVEIDPPRSIRIDRTIEAARLLRDAGVDLVNISDSAMARVRMGAMAVAFGIQHDLDLECLVHFTTRDRNLMAIESELLGAHALGVRNILALTGDPPRVGDYPAGTRRLGRRLDRARRDPRPAQPRRGPGRVPDRPAGRLHRSPARSTRPPPTPRPSGTGSSASSRRARTSS